MLISQVPIILYLFQDSGCMFKICVGSDLFNDDENTHETIENSSLNISKQGKKDLLELKALLSFQTAQT